MSGQSSQSGQCTSCILHRLSAAPNATPVNTSAPHSPRLVSSSHNCDASFPLSARPRSNPPPPLHASRYLFVVASREPQRRLLASRLVSCFPRRHPDDADDANDSGLDTAFRLSLPCFVIFPFFPFPFSFPPCFLFCLVVHPRQSRFRNFFDRDPRASAPPLTFIVHVKSHREELACPLLDPCPFGSDTAT